MEKISIIVPVWKDTHLNRTIRSLTEQTYKDLEIILVDDGAQGQAPMICDEWARKDSRIVVIHKENGGICSARNAGLKKVSGDYIAFSDDDDMYEKNAFERYYEVLKEKKCDIVWGNARVIYENGSVAQKDEEYSYDIEIRTKEEQIIHFLKYKHMTVWGGLYKKGIWDNVFFDETIISHEDFQVLGIILQKVNSVAFIDAPLYNYYMYGNSVSHNLTIKHIRSELKVADELESIYAKSYPNEMVTYKMLLYYSVIPMIDKTDEEGKQILKRIKKYSKEHWKELTHVDLSRRKGIKQKVIAFSIIPGLYDIKTILKKTKWS